VELELELVLEGDKAALAAGRLVARPVLLAVVVVEPRIVPEPLRGGWRWGEA